MRTISIINLKGGVAKTTSSINIAYILAEKGYKVLLLDNDIQGDCSRGLNRRTTEGDGTNRIMLDRNAQVYANTGAGTYEKAVDMATKDFLRAGLNCIEYANGSRHTIADYADMAIRTASKRAYLQGEGQMRQGWGLHLVIINKRGKGCPCPLCVPFVGKIMIDDVWSGGSRKDGKYPLMSSAVAAGLYHPRCRDSHTTYFPGITKVDPKYNKQELSDLEAQAQQEAKQQYAAR